MTYQQAMTKANEMFAYYKTRIWVGEKKGVYYVAYRPQATVDLNVVAIIG